MRTHASEVLSTVKLMGKIIYCSVVWPPKVETLLFWKILKYWKNIDFTGNQCESMPCIAILISTSKNPCSFLLLLILSLQQN
jgi:hypothetical protein